MPKLPLSLPLSLLLALGTPLAAAAPDADIASAPVQVELVAEHTALAPGRTEPLGLRLRHSPHWHTYWINPGDSGLPTTLQWTLPPGFRADAIAWPVPQRFEVGGLYNFGYDGEILLPVSMTVPADAQPGSTARLAVAVAWLACREECVPGKANLELELPIAREAPAPDQRWVRPFSAARLAQPQAAAWKAVAREDGGRFVITLNGPGLPPATAGLDAFAARKKLLDNKPPAIRHNGAALVVESGKSEYFTNASEFDLWLIAGGATGPRGWRVRVPLGAGAPQRPRRLSPTP